LSRREERRGAHRQREGEWLKGKTTIPTMTEYCNILFFVIYCNILFVCTDCLKLCKTIWRQDWHVVCLPAKVTSSIWAGSSYVKCGPRT
jgi:hypothetical protein